MYRASLSANTGVRSGMFPDATAWRLVRIEIHLCALLISAWETDCNVGLAWPSPARLTRLVRPAWSARPGPPGLPGLRLSARPGRQAQLARLCPGAAG